MEHDCIQEERISNTEKRTMNTEEITREISGDIKTLIAEFKAMNGSLKTTKDEFGKHSDESKIYRRQIDIIWVGIQSFKWVALFLFGSGILWKIIEMINGK